ncbi:glycoside hydrolase family 16 protein [Brucepastera parasyntrophica]|uniref:glycoside hydrolase family 16 protein n=1 Tax=Brucepastera parasyntrophica TaxID=2880008 RepID=UPI00210B853F|nr:glycoside hydrolase family 16 protein [Brucepastera parasyntrophica]ULQ59832.1 glycoside hydrolase family 16 protein [Brucepastera parasyntrophica]
MPTEDFPANPPEKKGCLPVFNDEFDSGILDEKKWLPYYLPQWSSRKNSKARYCFRGNNLVLQITADQKPWCPEFNGGVKVSGLQTGVFSGPAGSPAGQHCFSKDCAVREFQQEKKLFTPQYGYTEIRCKGSPDPENVCAFWMIGFEDKPEHSAEICIFELKGGNAGKCSSIIGYGIHPFGDPEIHDEFFEQEFPINAADFHIYGADWTPGGQPSISITRRYILQNKAPPTLCSIC